MKANPTVFIEAVVAVLAFAAEVAIVVAILVWVK